MRDSDVADSIPPKTSHKKALKSLWKVSQPGGGRINKVLSPIGAVGRNIRIVNQSMPQ